MRTLKKLLKTIKKRIEERTYGNYGICSYVLEDTNNNNFTIEEYLYVIDYLKENKPTPKKNSRFYVGYTSTAHWWPVEDKEIRIKFLDFLIKKITIWDEIKFKIGTFF